MILGIATMVAFVGSMVVIDIKPLGPWVALALLGSWTLLAFWSSASQDRQDRAAGRIPDPTLQKRSKLARVIQVPFFLSSLGCFAYAQWLIQKGAPRDVSQPYSDAALMLLLIFWIVGLTTESIISWVSRRQIRTSKPL